MPITVIAGRAGTGKSRSLLQRIRCDMNSGASILFLVPDQFKLETERWLMEQLHLPGLWQIQVIGLTRLALRLREEAGGAARIPLDERGQLMALRRAAARSRLEVFTGAAGRPAFLQMLLGTLSELKQTMVAPETLARVDDPLLSRKVKDLMTLEQAYREFMGTRYMDGNDLMLGMLPLMEQAELLKDAHVYVDGWDRRDPLALAVLEKLTRLAAHVTFTLTLDPDAPEDPLFEGQMQLFRAIRRMDPAAETVFTRGEGAAQAFAPALKHVERYLFAPIAPAFEEEPRGLHLLRARDPEQEACMLAAAMLRLAQNGTRYGRMALLTADPDQAPLFRRILQRHGIPAFVDVSLSLAHHGAVTFIDRALALTQSGRCGHLLECLATGFAPFTQEEADELTAYLRSNSVPYLQYPFRLEGALPLETLEALRLRAAEMLAPLQEKQHTVEDRCRCLIRFLLACDMPGRLQQRVEAYRGQGLAEEAVAEGQVWPAIVELADQLVSLMGNERCDAGEFRKLLSAGFSASRAGVLPVVTDAVLIGTVGRTRSGEIDALFIAGLNEGLLPPQPKEDPLLNDGDRRRLLQLGVEIASGRDRSRQERMWDLYQAVARPEKELFLSYTLKDMSGGSLFPSPYVHTLQKLFPRLQLHTDLEFPDLPVAAAAVQPLYTALRAYKEGAELDGAWLPVISWFLREQPKVLELARQDLAFDNNDGRIPPHLADALFGAKTAMAVTQLEQYAACPFAHLVEHGLKPQRERSGTVDAVTVGNFLHAAMQVYAGNVQARGEGFDLPETVRDAMLDEALDEAKTQLALDEGRARNEYAVERLTRLCRAAAKTLSDHLAKGDFRPWGQEIAFGPGGRLPALTEGLPVPLMGRIDYADVCTIGGVTYVRTLDYKSSARALEPGQILAGLQLQLPLYLLALEQGLDARSAGAFYFSPDEAPVSGDDDDPVKQQAQRTRLQGLAAEDEAVLARLERDMEGASTTMANVKTGGGSNSLQPQVLEALLLAARDTGGRLTKAMLAGEAPASPVDKGNNRVVCSYCNYKAICLFDRQFPSNRCRKVARIKKEDLPAALAQQAPGKEDDRAALDE